MTLFVSRDALADRYSGTTKWERLLAALDAGRTLPPGVTFSIGDSLTYRRTDPVVLADDLFVSHRRYQTVLAVLDGELHVELATPDALTRVDAYSDLSDREHSRLDDPTAASVRNVTAGQILAVPIDHAWRVQPDPAADVVIVRLTVEGATFHNK